MKFRVRLYEGGSTFTEEIRARNEYEARETAKARNPYARVISVNVTFF